MGRPRMTASCIQLCDNHMLRTAVNLCTLLLSTSLYIALINTPLTFIHLRLQLRLMEQMSRRHEAQAAAESRKIEAASRRAAEEAEQKLAAEQASVAEQVLAAAVAASASQVAADQLQEQQRQQQAVASQQQSGVSHSALSQSSLYAIAMQQAAFDAASRRAPAQNFAQQQSAPPPVGLSTPPPFSRLFLTPSLRLHLSVDLFGLYCTKRFRCALSNVMIIFYDTNDNSTSVNSKYVMSLSESRTPPTRKY